MSKKKQSSPVEASMSAPMAAVPAMEAPMTDNLDVEIASVMPQATPIEVAPQVDDDRVDDDRVDDDWVDDDRVGVEAAPRKMTVVVGDVPPVVDAPKPGKDVPVAALKRFIPKKTAEEMRRGAESIEPYNG